jgi:hypothetical protein
LGPGRTNALLLPATFATALVAAASDSQIVLHVFDAGDVFNQILGGSPLLPIVHGTPEADLAPCHNDFDFGGVDKGILGQPVCDILENTLV